MAGRDVGRKGLGMLKVFAAELTLERGCGGDDRSRFVSLEMIVHSALMFLCNTADVTHELTGGILLICVGHLRCWSSAGVSDYNFHGAGVRRAGLR